MERLRKPVKLIPRLRRRNKEILSLFPPFSYKYSLGSTSRKKKNIWNERIWAVTEESEKRKCLYVKNRFCNL